MFVKKVFIKLYLKLIFFSLIFFLGINSSVISAVLTEEELKYIEEQNEEFNDKENKEYIKYEDIKEKKTKKKPFIFFGSKKKKIKRKS